MNFENWEYVESKLPTDAQEQEQLLKTLKEKFRQEAVASEAVQKWLEQFHDKSIEGFINNYVNYKISIVKHSSYYIKIAEQVPELKFRDRTEAAFAIILQKKLFNLQCQWRAEVIELPGIRICRDFRYWEDNILNCPFIDPVTDTEIEVMQRYMLTEDFEIDWIDGTIGDWQDYDRLKKYEEESNFDESVMPWYHFYDTYMGTGMLQTLPNIRGQKEAMYLAAHSRKLQEEQKAVKTEVAPYVHTPFKDSLWYSVHRFYELACVFDDPCFTTLMKANSEEEAEGDALENEEGEADYYIDQLQNIPDLPPVRGGLSWRLALRYCYEDYLKSIVSRDLTTVCEEYHLHRSMGINYETSKYVDESLDDYDISKIFIDHILEGRAALGEPENLDF